MRIPYTYTVVSVDEAARCMEIRYESEGRKPHHVGARLPYENESLEAVVEMYAPMGFWLEEERKVIVPSVGASGKIAPAPFTAQEDSQNAAMWQQIDFEKQVGDALVKFGVLTSNPATMPVAEL